MKEAKKSSHLSKERRRSGKSKETKNPKPRPKETKKPKPSEKSPKPKNEERRQQKLDEQPSSDNDMELNEEMWKDLPKPYRPIRFFVDDKTELIEQVFAALQGPALEQIVPQSLKNYSQTELKKMCMQQLETMTKKNILHILSGKDPDSREFAAEKKRPSLTATEQEKLPEASTSLKRKLQDNVAPSSLAETDMKKFAHVDSTENEPKSPLDSESTSNDALELYPTETEVDIMNHESKKKDASKPIQWEEGSDLELLELEMRARAIRSLLRARGLPSSSSEDENSGVA